MAQLQQWTGAGELARRIATGEVTSREVVADHLAAAEHVDAHTNAVVWRMAEAALSAADEADRAVAAGEDLPPLHGVPVSIKECYRVVGTPATWGLVSRAGVLDETEGPLLGRLRAAGAIPFVKTNVPVLLMQNETHNPLHGRTTNPWDRDRSPGGSSGGEAALVAAGGSPLGLGGDIGGSLRVPAHVTGIATLKATSGRLPSTDRPDAFPPGQHEILSVDGPMARTVADVALAHRALVTPVAGEVGDPRVAPTSPSDPDEIDLAGLRVGVVDDDAFFGASPAIRRAVREAAAALEDAGATTVPWTLPDLAQVLGLYTAILGADGFAGIRDRMGDDPRTPMIDFMLDVGGRVPHALAGPLAAAAGAARQRSFAPVLRRAGARSVAAYRRMVVEQRTLQLDEQARWQAAGLDLVLQPPTAHVAVRHDTFRDLTGAQGTNFVANLLGVPAGVVPVTSVRPGEESDRRPGSDAMQRLAARLEHGSAGLPVGVQVVGRWWREDQVLAAMAAIEPRVDGSGRPTLD